MERRKETHEKERQRRKIRKWMRCRIGGRRRTEGPYCVRRREDDRGQRKR